MSAIESKVTKIIIDQLDVTEKDKRFYTSLRLRRGVLDRDP